MTSTKASPNRPLAFWFTRPLHWLLTTITFLCRVVLIGWPTLAIYYSNLPWFWVRLALALAFMAFSVWIFWRSRRLSMFLIYAGLSFFIVLWFLAIRPSHDRHWRPEASVMPRAIIDGDSVRITNVRNFDYRSKDDFTVRYENREVQLSHLTGVDFFVSYWMPGPVAHTFLSFTFDNAPPLCVSIEARPEMGEGFSPVASLFRKFELIYIVGNERDLVGVRTNHRHEEVFLYPLRISPESARALFLIYLDRINELADRAEFYNLLNSSCTINIVRYANAVGKPTRFDFRYILNGLVDRYLYCKGFMDTTLPFEELRPRSRINAAAQAAGDGPDFSQRIRADLPPTETMRPPALP